MKTVQDEERLLACNVLKFFITISKLLEAETKLKLIYIIHLKVGLCYMIKIYVYIFLSHKSLHMMWRSLGSSIFFSFVYAEFWIGKCIYFFVAALCLLCFDGCLIYSVWTVVFM